MRRTGDSRFALDVRLGVGTVLWPPLVPRGYDRGAPVHCTVEQLTDPDGTARLVVQGELDLAATPMLRTALEALRREARSAVLDLRELTFMDSSGLRVLLECGRHRAAGWGVSLLLPAGGAVRRLIAITGVEDALPPPPR